MYKIYKAKWILPANEKIIENGAVMVENGKIIDVINEDQIKGINPEQVTDYKNAVITPGFINMHTHLQFTNLEKTAGPEKDFVHWVLDLMSKYSKWNISQKIDSLKTGAKEALLSGTTCIVQLSGEMEFFEALNNLDIRTYLFLEIFSNTEEISIREFEKLKEKIDIIKQSQSELVNVGISPHSVYNVHPVLWEKISQFASKNNYLVQTHLAESTAEMQWLKKGYSDIDLIHKFVGWEKITPHKTGLTPLEYLEKLNILQKLDKNLILAHLNQLDGELFEKLDKYNTKIAHCPRSNVILHGKTLDIKRLINTGYPFNSLAIGTDSKYSNNDLNIINEIKFIKNQTGLGTLKLLDMITINAARILQLDKKIGSLEKTKEADFLVFMLDENETYQDFINKKGPDDIYIKGRQIVQNKELIREIS